MRPYPENKHQLGVTGEESCEQCVLCLFCSQADRQIIMSDTPPHSEHAREMKRRNTQTHALHFIKMFDVIHRCEKKSAYASFPLETRTANGLVNQEFSVVNVVWRSTDAQQNKIIEQAKQLSCNVPEIVVINRNFENLCLVAFPIIIPHVQYTVA